jgi:hypothetical protein
MTPTIGAASLSTPVTIQPFVHTARLQDKSVAWSQARVVARRLARRGIAIQLRCLRWKSA